MLGLFTLKGGAPQLPFLVVLPCATLLFYSRAALPAHEAARFLPLLLATQADAGRARSEADPDGLHAFCRRAPEAPAARRSGRWHGAHLYEQPQLSAVFEAERPEVAMVAP